MKINYGAAVVFLGLLVYADSNHMSIVGWALAGIAALIAMTD